MAYMQVLWATAELALPYPAAYCMSLRSTLVQQVIKYFKNKNVYHRLTVL